MDRLQSTTRRGTDLDRLGVLSGIVVTPERPGRDPVSLSANDAQAPVDVLAVRPLHRAVNLALLDDGAALSLCGETHLVQPLDRQRLRLTAGVKQPINVGAPWERSFDHLLTNYRRETA